MKRHVLFIISVLMINLGISQNVPAFEDVPVYRIQVKVETDVIKDAGSDGNFGIQLNRNDQFFKLDLALDDFKPGSVRVYDIISQSVNKIKDIQFLKFKAMTTDAWCIKRVELIINGALVFRHRYAGCEWLDENHESGQDKRYLIFDSNTLRRDQNWNHSNKDQYFTVFPGNIPKAFILDLVEAIVGDATVGSDIDWGRKFGSDYVEAEYKDNKTLKFDLDMIYDAPGPINPEVDVDFEIRFICENGKPGTILMNQKINVGDNIVENTIAKVVNYFSGYDIYGLIRSGIEKALTFDRAGGIFNGQFISVSNCTDLQVTSRGDVVILNPQFLVQSNPNSKLNQTPSNSYTTTGNTTTPPGSNTSSRKSTGWGRSLSSNSNKKTKPIVIYSQSDFRGKRLDLGVGQYSPQDLRKAGIKRINSIKIKPGYIPYLIKETGQEERVWKDRGKLYAKFTGIRITDASNKEKSKRQTKATVSKPPRKLGGNATPKPDNKTKPIVVFSQANFAGKSLDLGVGKYTREDLMKAGIKRINSIKIKPGYIPYLIKESGQEERVWKDRGKLYAKFTGIRITASPKSGNPKKNKQVKKNQRENLAVKVHFRSKFGRNSVDLPVGNYTSKALYAKLKTSGFSKITVPQGLKAEVFRSPNLTGPSRTVAGGKTLNFNGRSVKILPE